jgi:hypothetical protein
VLLSDRPALAAEDAATMRVVAAKRKLVEVNVKMAARMKVACLEGLDFAGKLFAVQTMDVEGLTEEEARALKVRKKMGKTVRKLFFRFNERIVFVKRPEI